MKELKISELLKELGIPANLLGYFYLKRAIGMMSKDMSLMCRVTKVLYPNIAKEFGTTPSRIERAIRHAIEVGWNRGNVELQNKLFGFSVDSERGKPTNTEFIGMVADWLNMTCCDGEETAKQETDSTLQQSAL